jgi:hypothetical protein
MHLLLKILCNIRGFYKTTQLSLLEGDVTGYSQYEDGVLVIYTEIAGQVQE